MHLHHFILQDGHVDGGKGVTHLLDTGCVVGIRHVFLPDIAQLLPEFKLYGRGASSENLVQVRQSFFWPLCVLNVAKQFFAETRCEAV